MITFFLLPSDLSSECMTDDNPEIILTLFAVFLQIICLPNLLGPAVGWSLAHDVVWGGIRWFWWRRCSNITQKKCLRCLIVFKSHHHSSDLIILWYIINLLGDSIISTFSSPPTDTWIIMHSSSCYRDLFSFFLHFLRNPRYSCTDYSQIPRINFNIWKSNH